MDKVEVASGFVFGIFVGYVLFTLKQVIEEEKQAQESQERPVRHKPKLYVVKTQ